MGRIWFITGCSSGFGRLLSERAFALGDSVVATARSTQSLGNIGRGDESRILRLPLDVQSQSDIDTAVERAIEKFGRIDILVNNAGYAYFGTQEEGSLEEVRAMFDTNIFGLIAMTQGVLPHMRSARTGTIINLSSIGGRIATPRGGFYQATKWGVEALSESLFLEVSEFGLRVIVIEPGAYETDFGPRSSRIAPAESSASSPYAAHRKRWKEVQEREVFPYSQNPAEVIDGILDAVACDLPFVRLPIGRDAVDFIRRREKMGMTAFVEWLRKLYNGRRE
ncbi:MAG: SDR family oxidoreductase [Bacteroidota bacterium]